MGSLLSLRYFFLRIIVSHQGPSINKCHNLTAVDQVIVTKMGTKWWELGFILKLSQHGLLMDCLGGGAMEYVKNRTARFLACHCQEKVAVR